MAKVGIVKIGFSQVGTFEFDPLQIARPQVNTTGSKLLRKTLEVPRVFMNFQPVMGCALATKFSINCLN